jgi:PiT family inorganic phosphate transporter
MDVYLGLISAVAFLLSFAIGANDAANALATSYGSKAAKLRNLLVLGAIFEFIGATLLSGNIASTLPNHLLPEMTQDHVPMIMLATSVSTMIIVMVSSLFGLPISGTHTMVEALIGAGIAK